MWFRPRRTPGQQDEQIGLCRRQAFGGGMAQASARITEASPTSTACTRADIGGVLSQIGAFSAQ